MTHWSEVIGEGIVKATAGIKVGNAGGWWDNYQKTTSRKEKLKDFFYVFGLLGFVLFSSWVLLNVNSFSAPHITYTRGGNTVSVSGNCSWIWGEWEREKNLILDINQGNSLVNLSDTSGNWTVRQLVPVSVYVFADNTTTTQPKCPPCQKCPKCKTCPTCPECNCPECEITEQEIKEALNWRMSHSEAPVCQRCASIAKREILGNIFGLEGVAKYNEGPSMGPLGTWYGVEVEGEGDFCFRDLGGYFLLNRTRMNENMSLREWNWNDDQCKSSVLKVYKP